MTGESKIVVCTEVKDGTFAAGNIDRDILSCGDHFLGLPSSSLAILTNYFPQPTKQCLYSFHVNTCLIDSRSCPSRLLTAAAAA
jgi:hypothetical protein